MRQVMPAVLALGLMLAAGAHIATAQDATPTADAEAEIMFVQTFASTTLAPSGDDPSIVILTLERGTGETIYFSDRPDRIAGSVETGTFIETFREETAQDPANAALVVRVSESEEVVHVVELLEMEHDEATGTLTYTARMLDDHTALDLQFPGEPQQAITTELSYGTSNLFIDAGGLLQIIAPGSQD